MSFESDFFKKKTVLFERLLPFGFVRNAEGYYYQEEFMAACFRAEIKISETGQVTGRVIDLDFGEDYLAFRAGRNSGSFVGEVRQAYSQILDRIAESCFEPCLFKSGQANRLVKRIQQDWGEAYDYPFAKYPDCVSYRIGGKWYALILPLKRDKLDGSDREKGEQQVEVVTLKVKPDQLASLLDREGIFPAYHMNKNNWVSLILDDSLNDEEIWELLAESRQLTAPADFRREGQAQFWVIPANPKVYDVDREFAEAALVSWPQKGKIRKGDYVFIYITAPVQALRYACQVLETNQEGAEHNGNQEISQTMTLKLLETFADSDFPIQLLKEQGVTNIRGARRLTDGMIALLKKHLDQGD